MNGNGGHSDGNGPSWQTVAAVCATILFSTAAGAGGYFVMQQATRDDRQDMLLDNVSQKLIDVSLALVSLKSDIGETKTAVSKEVTLREERDRRELDDYRRRASESKK